MGACMHLALCGLLTVATAWASEESVGQGASEQFDILPAQDELTLAKYDSLMEADALRLAAKLRRESQSPMFAESSVVLALAWLSTAIALSGICLLVCRVVAGRRKKMLDAQWSRCLVALGATCGTTQLVGALPHDGDAPVLVPITRAAKPRTKDRASSVPVIAAQQLRRAA